MTAGSGLPVLLFLALAFTEADGAIRNPSRPLGRRSSFAQAILRRHNCYRNTIAGMNALTWNAEAAEYAFNYTSRTLKSVCDISEHSPKEWRSGVFGENLAIAMRSGPFVKSLEKMAEGAVDRWYGEIQRFVYRQDQHFKFCSETSGTGHFTQFMWETVESVGCSYVTCSTGSLPYSLIVSCNYNPPGNIKNRPVFGVEAADRLACAGFNRQFGGLRRCDSSGRTIDWTPECQEEPEQLPCPAYSALQSAASGNSVLALTKIVALTLVLIKL